MHRNATPGGDDTSVPPTPGDSRCTDVGTFTIQRGVVYENGAGINTSMLDPSSTDDESSILSVPCAAEFA